MCAVAEKIHLFEQAGLGKAPFRFLGVQTANDRAAVERERECNGMTFTTNHATSCDYCGQGIFNAYQIESADGKRFKVGCDCIRKTGDAGLKRHVLAEERTKRQAKAQTVRQARLQRENELVSAFRAGQGHDALKTMPHPKGRPDCTAFDYVDWCMTNKMMGSTAMTLIEKALTLTGCPKQ